jgi:signal transduction histidine kinase
MSKFWTPPAARRQPMPTEATLLQGVAVARWFAWGWVAITTMLQRDDLRHPLSAFALIALALVGCGIWTWFLLRAPHWLLSKRVAVWELIFSVLMISADGWVFKAGHNFVGGQSLSGSGPLVAALAASAILGPLRGTVLAMLVGSSRLIGARLNGYHDWNSDNLISIAASVVQFGIAALMFGYVTKQLRLVETEVVTRRARDEVASTLHDGVLQTLALVARRTSVSDPELAAVARTSDRELRSWLFHGSRSDGDRAREGLEVALRHAADHVSRTYDLAITVSVVPDDDHEPAPEVVGALAGATRECLTNAAKHAEASQVIVYAEDIDGVVFVSIRDDGKGFDASATSDRAGINGSVKRRMADIGGRVEIQSRPGSGTEVRLWSR